MRKTTWLLALVTTTTFLACKSEPKPSAKAPAEDPWANKAPGPKAPAEAKPAAGTEPVLQKPFFYVAQKDGHTAYLLGTMHLGVSMESLPPTVLTAFAGVKQLFVEANVNDPAILVSVIRKDGKTLEDDLGKEHFAKFAAIVGEGQAAGAKRLKPAMAATLLQMQGLPQTGFMDMALVQKAKAAGTAVGYLEEATHQLALLEKWITAKAMIAMLDKIEEVKKNNQQLLDLYRAGDDATMLALANDKSQADSFGISAEEQEAMMQDLLFARNASWIAPIEAAAAKEPVFVAVGALHLIGPKSVVELLQARGWQIERRQ